MVEMLAGSSIALVFLNELWIGFLGEKTRNMWDIIAASDMEAIRGEAALRWEVCGCALIYFMRLCAFSMKLAI